MDLLGSVCRDLAAVVGAVMVVYGLQICYPPAAWVVAGGLVMAAAVLWSRAKQTVGGDKRRQESEVDDEGSA